MKKKFRQWLERQKNKWTAIHDKKAIIALLNKSSEDRLSEDELSLFNHLFKYARPSRQVTRKGKSKIVLPMINEVTFGQVLQAREYASSKDYNAIIKAFSGYDAEKVGDIIVCAKWVIEQLRFAYKFESEQMGIFEELEAEEPDAIDSEIGKARMLQIVAEGMRIKTEEAKDVLYKDAIIWIIKNKKDYDREIEAIRRNRAQAL